MAYFVVPKLIVSCAYAIFFFLITLIFSSYLFSIFLKPGFFIAVSVMSIGIVTSAILGVTASFLFVEESNVYLCGAIYVLLMFVLCGYIDDLREGNTVLEWIANILPLKFVNDPFSNWMLFGSNDRIGQRTPVGLVAQLIFASALLSGVLSHKRMTA